MSDMGKQGKGNGGLTTDGRTVFVVTCYAVKYERRAGHLVSDEDFENSPDIVYDPIVTVFDNKENAVKMYNHMLGQGTPASIDECPLFKEFLIDGEVTEHECNK